MPTLRADISDVYVFRRGGRVPEFLQLRRTREPLVGTWQPIMGHAREGETARATALRELKEETGLSPGSPGFLGMWSLDQVHPFYIAALDCICLSPRFAVEAAPAWIPILNEEHDAARWTPADDAASFVWPGQRAGVAEVLEILRGGVAERLLRVRLDNG